MLIALSIAALMGMLVGSAGLVLFAGFRLRDLLLLGFLTSVALYLSRFDLQFSTTILGRPYVGFDFYLLLSIVVLIPIRAIFRGSPGLRATPSVLLFLAFAVLSLISGLLNRGFIGVGAALQILVVTFAPFSVAGLWVDLMPRDRTTHQRLLLSFVLLVGVLTPVVFVVTSIAPNTVGSVLGWSSMSAGRSAGFVRGWSPLGGAIATGMLMVIAYGLAMHQVVGRHRRRYIPVLVLIGVAVLFTLSRSVLLMFIMFHAVYFWSAIRRQPIRMLGLGAVALIIMTPIMFELRDRYSFERFTEYQDESTDIRASSAVAAIEAAFERPFLGHGPGLLYEQIRTEGVTAGATTQPRAMYVGNRISALEPHDLFLLLAAEHGIPAAVLFVLGMVFMWWRTRIDPLLVYEEDRSMASALNAIWVASLLMFVTHSGPLVNAQESVFFWFFAFVGLHWHTVVLSAESVAAEPVLVSHSTAGRWLVQPTG